MKINKSDLLDKQKFKKRFETIKIKLLLSLSSLSIDENNHKRLIVYPEHGIVFNRIKKSANSAVLIYNAQVLAFNSGDDFSIRSHSGMSLKEKVIRQGFRALWLLPRYVTKL